MIKKIVTLALTIANLIVFAQDIKEVNSEIKAVTVYLNGAEINRIANVSIQKGTNEIKLIGLSPYIQPSSIQVKANNNAITIVSVNHEINYLDETNLSRSPKVSAITDSIEKLELALALRKSYENVYNEEKSLLLANKNIGGVNTGVDIENLMDAADFFRERLMNIEIKLLDIQRNKKDIAAAIARFTKQRSLYYNTVNNTSELVVNLTSSLKATVELEVSFIVSNAGWIPFYDIRSNNLTKPVNLTYKGKVYQKTGNDWNNVAIKLSTGNPSVDNTQPTFSNWYLQYYTAYNNDTKMRSKSMAPAPVMSESLASYDTSLELEETQVRNESVADYTTVKQNMVTTTFNVALPYSIKSDGKPNLIEVQKYELPVTYQYFAMPNKDSDAFLLAKIAGWGDYNLMAGGANIYFENTFVGESYLETAITNDTIKISMGRDKSIVIQRDKIKDFSKNTTFGSSQKSTRGYEIKVRNNKSQAIEIELIDQVPLSSLKEIEVTLMESDNATYDEKTGKLTWRLTIPANSSSGVAFKYAVKYPKDKIINNL